MIKHQSNNIDNNVQKVIVDSALLLLCVKWSVFSVVAVEDILSAGCEISDTTMSSAGAVFSSQETEN